MKNPIMLGFFMKKLATDTSQEEITRIVNILKKNEIPYHLETIFDRGTWGRGYDAAAYRQANISMYKGSIQPTNVFVVRVRHRDFARAEDLVRK